MENINIAPFMRPTIVHPGHVFPLVYLVPIMVTMAQPLTAPYMYFFSLRNTYRSKAGFWSNILTE